MVMEFDQYLQLCDVTESRYLAIYESMTKPQPFVCRPATGVEGQSTGPASLSTEDRPSSGDDDLDGFAASPTKNRCVWECNFDSDDAELILTSQTVSFERLIKRLIHINTLRNKSRKTFIRLP